MTDTNHEAVERLTRKLRTGWPIGPGDRIACDIMGEATDLIEKSQARIAVLEAEVVRLSQPAPVEPVAWRDVLTERQRQISAEGWTHEHDDRHAGGDIARAAAAYAIGSTEYPKIRGHQPPGSWPWDARWWKSTDRRRDLVKAGALILAEIERLDRAVLAKQGGA